MMSLLCSHCLLFYELRTYPNWLINKNAYEKDIIDDGP